MCGIAGLWDRQAQQQEQAGRARVFAMTQAIAHRGPDGDGLWSNPARGVFLGHRRLAIVDLSPAGAQPMHAASERFTIVFNGEIYNHIELRQALEAEQARAWRGHSDTEVLLAGFEQWGIERTLAKAVGMFAIALWDQAEDCLWLARDRLGEKPLYLIENGAQLAFASELGALRASGLVQGGVSPAALASLLRSGYVAEGLSIEAGVEQLAPAHWLRIDRHGRRQLQRYWHAFAAPKLGLNDQEAVDELERRLEKAIGLQLMADVPVGAFLSGGVDSSLIAALGQKICGGKLETFTIGFEEQGYNEAPHAAGVARHLGTRHSEVTVSGRDALALVPQLSRHYGEPFADPSALPTVLLMRAARRQVTVALSGDAGDELFAGYGRYLQYPKAYASMQRIPAALRHALPGMLGRGGRLFDLAGRCLGRPQLGDQLEKGLPLLGAQAFADFAQDFAALWRHPAELMLQSTTTGPSGYGLLDATDGDLARAEAMSRHDLVDYLPADILVKVDRAAMSASLETRTPLLDHRVVEFAFQCPIEQKIRDGRGKWLLRQLLQRHVPLELIDRPKQGFSAPIGIWLRTELRDWAEELLSPARMQQQGLLNARLVQRYWQEHLSKRRDWSRRLWPILMLQQWLADRTANQAEQRQEFGNPRMCA